MGMKMVIFNESSPFTLPYEPFGRNTGRKGGVSRGGGDGGDGGGGWGDRELAGKRGGKESAVLLIRAAL